MIDITTLRDQRARLRAAYRDSILLFRTGDEFIVLDDDAETAGRVLGLSPDSECRLSIPVSGAEAMIAALVAAGCKVAICEQIGEGRV